MFDKNQARRLIGSWRDDPAALRERPDLDVDPLFREAVRVRPAGGIGRDDRHRDAECLDLLRQAVAVPVLMVLGRCAQQDLVARPRCRTRSGREPAPRSATMRT